MQLTIFACLKFKIVRYIFRDGWIVFLVKKNSLLKQLKFYLIKSNTVTSGDKSMFGSLFKRRAAAFTSFFLAAMCKAGKRILPRESFSNRMATTFSWPCCNATANGVNPSSVARLWLALLANRNLTTSTWFSWAALLEQKFQHSINSNKKRFNILVLKVINT